jgi:hypothetical protein
MDSGSHLDSAQQSRQRDLLVVGLQIAAGLMMAQQIAGKAARDGLFLQQYGPRALPAMVAGAAAFSVLLSLLNGGLMRRSAPRFVIPWAIGLSGVLQLAEWGLLQASPALAAVAIYLHMAGVGAVLLSGFWSMLNEEFDPREAKRKFGRIAAGGAAGGLVGGLVAERTAAWSGAPALMLVLAGLHLSCGAFLFLLMRRSAGPPSPEGDAAARPLAPHKSSLLLTLGAIVLLGSVGAALLDYVFKVYAAETWGRGNGLLRFFALFHTAVALASVLLQSTVSKLVLGKFGLGTAVLTLPATLAGGSFLALVAPGAIVAALARAAEAAVHNSLFRAGYETCYTPVPAGEKRLAKAVIDVGSERGGDAIGAAVVFLCLQLAGQSALPWMLSIAALVGFSSVILCLSLDRVYLQALARSLESRAVRLNESDLDLTTLSLIMPRSPAPPGPAAAEPSRQDAVLEQLAALRSSDARQVHAALSAGDVTDRLVATQVCLLLVRPEYVRLAQGALFRSTGKVLGLLTDLMLDANVDVAVRRRIPRIVASAPCQRAADALLAGLEDPRFEVRMQCARSLARTSEWTDRPLIQASRILTAVDRELAVGAVLWESHRQQQRDPGEPGAEWLDALLRDKAHGSLEYVFTLLSLIHDRAPLMAAFRSLHLEDRRLRGTALEYLEGILPATTRESLWEILGEQPSRSAGRSKSDVLQELLNTSETVVLRLRQNG